MRKLILILALLAIAVPTFAAFDNISISPRVRGMGDAGVAIADDAFAPYYNPAGLASITGGMIGSSSVKPYGTSFMDVTYFGGVAQIGDLGGIGFGYRQFVSEYQDIELMSEDTYTMSWGKTLYTDIHTSINFGISANMYRLEFAETVGGQDPGNDTTVGIDAGLTVGLHNRTRLGVMVKNLNNPVIGIDNQDLRQSINAGIGYSPYIGVWTVFEMEHTIDGELQYHGGLEFEVLSGLVLRAGTMTNPNKMTAGFGYNAAGVGVNYGFSTGGGVLDDSHQFGLTFGWGGE
ncbi:hypothetical protein HN843_01120 [bacterium]|nr:hypothetical protein [bacterium]